MREAPFETIDEINIKTTGRNVATSADGSANKSSVGDALLFTGESTCTIREDGAKCEFSTLVAERLEETLRLRISTENSNNITVNGYKIVRLESLLSQLAKPLNVRLISGTIAKRDEVE